jgi:hypothetical protein
MLRWFLHRSVVVLGVTAFVWSCVALSDEPGVATRRVESSLSRELADAERAGDLVKVREVAARGLKSLGEQAGLPEVADEFVKPPAEVAPLTPEEIDQAFRRIDEFVKRRKWWKVGLDPTKTERLPRELASIIVGCVAGCRVKASCSDSLRQTAVEAGDYLLWTQTVAGTGVIPFPAYRGGGNKALEAAARFLKQAERDGRWDEVVKEGWAFEDLDDGGLQFDNGLCGVALWELAELTGEARFRYGALQATEWTLQRRCVPNWNYNAFSVYLLATGHRAMGDRGWLDGAIEKTRLGLLPGQLREGPHAGRWGDPHNARPAYHYIIVRGLAALWRELPAEHAFRPELRDALRLALESRNREFVERGVMNSDSAIEALALCREFPEGLREELGPCGIDAAWDVLRRHCTTRLGAGEAPFSPGVGGRFFEDALRK